MNSKMLVIITAVVVVIGAVVLLSSRQTANNTASTNPPTETPPTVSPSVVGSEAAVSVTSTGFEPATITVKTGEKVTWTNKSGSDVSINSNPHPTHTDYPELNIGIVNNGSSASLVFDKPGTYGYHNHLQPSQKGTIVVK